MAYRRRHGITRSSTFKEETYHPPNHIIAASSSSSSVASAPSSPLGSHHHASRPLVAHRESPLSSGGHVNSSFHSSYGDRPKEGGYNADKRAQDIQETFKNHEDFWLQNQWQDGRMCSSQPQPQPQTIYEHQLKASRDVAIATAAKAKLLLREIKTVKADLAFAIQRSSQLEVENKMLREAREKGDHPADDEMIRLQLETLLAEKGRLAHENSVYVRENSCLREIIKYHKLSMQGLMYMDEGIEEVPEVKPKISRTLSASPPLPSSPQTRISFTTKKIPLIPKTIDVPTMDNRPIKSTINNVGT